jgi:sulfur carrier protein
MVQVLVNGQPRRLEAGATVQSIVAGCPDAPQGRGLAVALDGEVVPRGAWGSTQLVEGARLEIVVAVQGG